MVNPSIPTTLLASLLAASALAEPPAQGEPGKGPPPPAQSEPGQGAPGQGGPGRGPREGGPGRGERPTFKTFDRNGDGVVTSDEVPAEVWERLKRLDADGDGKITEDEFRQGRPGRGRDGQRPSQGGPRKPGQQPADQPSKRID